MMHPSCLQVDSSETAILHPRNLKLNPSPITDLLESGGDEGRAQQRGSRGALKVHMDWGRRQERPLVSHSFLMPTAH